MGKKISIVMAFALAVFFISSAYAITGSIGNARMILRASVGDEIEKYILVKNVNDVPINIELLASGDLEKYITIKDNNLTLSPGGEKRAYFTIKVGKNGTTESQINIKFTPSEGNGVGLTSTIIVIASGEGEVKENGDLDNKNNDSGDSNPGKKSIVFILLLATTGIILIIFIVLMLVVSNKNKRTKESFEEIKPKSVKKK